MDEEHALIFSVRDVVSIMESDTDLLISTLVGLAAFSRIFGKYPTEILRQRRKNWDWESIDSFLSHLGIVGKFLAEGTIISAMPDLDKIVMEHLEMPEQEVKRLMGQAKQFGPNITGEKEKETRNEPYK